MKLSHKLTLAFALFLLGFAALLIIFDNLFIDRYFLYTTKKTLKEEYSSVTEYFNSDEFDETNYSYLYKLNEISINSNTVITFFYPNGQRARIGNEPLQPGTMFFDSLNDLRLTDSSGNSITDYKSVISKDGTIIDFNDPEEKETKNVGLIGQIVIDNETFGYVFLYTSYTVMQENIKTFNTFVLYISLISLVLSAVIATIVSTQLTKPIKQIEEKTKKISNLDFSSGVIEYKGTDEIGDLAKSINKMSNELEKSISELKDANQKLEDDIKFKERVNKLREEFISDVSHELKTPISIISGYSEALKLEGISKEELSDYADIIIDESNRMNKLVRDLLKFTQIESGFITLDKEEIRIQDIINDVIKPLELKLNDKKIKLNVDVADEIIIGDYDMIETVFNNLFTNAINYCDKEIREIKVYSEILNDKMRIYVYNSGEQISEENQKRIFESFYRIDKSRSRKYGGSGLGLSIVKSIMDAYKNEFGIRNEVTGVSFYFDLDLKRNEE